jgi:propane monooxygenase coupling protein
VTTASLKGVVDSPYVQNSTSSNRAGMTLMNDQVGEVIAQVMKDKPGVQVTYLPSMIRIDGEGRTDFLYDEFAEALGEEPGSFTSADLEESMSTHYGRMVHEDDRTIMFANPEDAAEYLGFDLTPLATADVPEARAAAD